jgi:hypothetical protein
MMMVRNCEILPGRFKVDKTCTAAAMMTAVVVVVMMRMMMIYNILDLSS